MQIHKFPISVGRSRVEVKGFVSVLHVEDQSGALHVWCLVDPDDQSTFVFDLDIFASGEQIPMIRKLRHLCTVLSSPDGRLVWHVFSDRDIPVGWGEEKPCRS